MAKELYIGPDKNDVQRRLGETICRFNGEPVYVSTSRDHVLQLYSLKDQKRIIQDYRVPEFDYRSAPLGYINVEGKAYYLSRLPDRSNQKQGLCYSMIKSSDPNFRVQDYFTNYEMRACILGEHPTLEKAVAQLEENEAESVAIHRHLAITKLNSSTLGLHYRARLIGTRERGAWRLLSSQDCSIIEPLVRKAGVPI